MDTYNGYYAASLIGCEWLAIHVDGSNQSYFSKDKLSTFGAICGEIQGKCRGPQQEERGGVEVSGI